MFIFSCIEAYAKRIMGKSHSQIRGVTEHLNKTEILKQGIRSTYTITTETEREKHGW